MPQSHSGDDVPRESGPDSVPSAAVELFFSTACRIVLFALRNAFALFRTPVRRSRLISLLRGLAPRSAAGLARRDLPEFGAFAGLPAAWIEDLVDALVEHGYIELGDGPAAGVRASLQTPPLRVSRAGLRALQGQESLPAEMIRGRRRRGEAGRLDARAEELEAKLFSLRRELAAEEGCPAYHVFPNALLGEIVLRRPRNLGELAELPGMGPHRLRKFGGPILALLREDHPDL